jgi:hypothetical protein
MDSKLVSDVREVNKRFVFYLPTERLSPWPKARFPNGVATAPPTPKPMPKPPEITKLTGINFCS